MIACAGDVRPVSLELGGKSVLVVFDDSPLEQAVEWAMFGCFWTNGQICSATSRVLGTAVQVANRVCKHVIRRPLL